MKDILENAQLMDWVYSFIGLVLIPFLIRLILRAGAYLLDKNEITQLDSYIQRIMGTVADVVRIVKQTMVDDLKASGNFTEEAQKEAFAKAFNMIMERLSEEAIVLIESLYGDATRFIEDKIEVIVSELKK